MAILVTSMGAGTKSLKVTNLSASPQSNYLINLATVGVIGDVWKQSVDIQNSNVQVMQELPLALISNIGASASPFTLQGAVDAIATLIIT